MYWIQLTFQRMEGLYSRLFADWLHINFIVRTVLLLLMLWLIIYVAALIFKYAVGPFVVFVYINVLLRAWNFLVTETIQEWIYIHHYSKGSQKHSALYLRLTDRVKRNREILSNNEKKSARRGRIRTLGNQMMITAGVIVALWVVAFGINQEYVAPAWAANGGGEGGNAPYIGNNEEPGNGEANGTTQPNGRPSNDTEYVPGLMRPGQFPPGVQISLALTQEAREGARLRSGPGTADTVVIEMLWGDGLLTYLGYYVPDADVSTLYWMRVLSPSGVTGYIGSHLVEVVA